MPDIRSSNAHPDYGDLAFEIAEDGTILKAHLDPDWTEGIPQRFDTAEFVQTYGELDDCIDILDIGCWDENGQYEPAEREFRELVAEELGLKEVSEDEGVLEASDLEFEVVQPCLVNDHGEN